MSIHDTFARNLRRKSEEFGSIADVCRGAGINRQQFNKYLAGNSIPNAITLRRICNFLNIQEHSLFVNEKRNVDEIEAAPFMPRRGPLGFFQFASKKYDFEIKDIPNGHYYCFMPVHKVSGVLVRVLLSIRQNGKQKEFVRLTRFPSASGSSKLLMRGRHKGIVFANSSEIYFLGINRYAPHQLSLMMIERGNGTSNGFSKGMIMTHSINAAISSKICMLYAEPQKDIKLLLSRLGSLHESEAKLDSVVMATLRS